jgi:hypothetical protein
MISQAYINELRNAANRANSTKHRRLGIDARCLLMLLQEIETHRCVLQLNEPQTRRNGVRHAHHQRQCPAGISA